MASGSLIEQSIFDLVSAILDERLKFMKGRRLGPEKGFNFLSKDVWSCQ